MGRGEKEGEKRQQGLAAIRAAGFLRESLADGLHLEVLACPQTLVRSHRAAMSTIQSFKPECLNNISPFTIQPGPDAPARSEIIGLKFGSRFPLTHHGFRPHITRLYKV